VRKKFSTYKNISIFNNIILDRIFKYKLHLTISNFNKFSFYIFSNLVSKMGVKSIQYIINTSKNFSFSTSRLESRGSNAVFFSNFIADILGLLFIRSTKDNLNKIFYKNGL
jgi:hypothetical protein